MTEPAPPVVASADFKWRDHIVISSVFSKEQHDMIARSLDSIFLAADHEGKDLLAAAVVNAYDINADHMLHIDPSTDPTSRSNYENGTLGLNIDGIAHSYFEVNGELRPPSLTGILVHELFHGGDDSVRPGVQQGLTVRALAPLFRSYGLNELDARTAAIEYWAFNHNGPPPGMQLHVLPRLSNIPGASEAIHQALHRAGLTDANDVWMIEHNATDFADAFMQKNFGDQEPHRGRYRNFVTVPTPHPIPEPRLFGITFPTVGFAAHVPDGLVSVNEPPIVRASTGRETAGHTH